MTLASAPAKTRGRLLPVAPDFSEDPALASTAQAGLGKTRALGDNECSMKLGELHRRGPDGKDVSWFSVVSFENPFWHPFREVGLRYE